MKPIIPLLLLAITLFLFSVGLAYFIIQSWVPEWKRYSDEYLEKRIARLNLKEKEILYNISMIEKGKKEKGEEEEEKIAKLKAELKDIESEKRRSSEEKGEDSPLFVSIEREDGSVSRERCISCHRAILDPFFEGDDPPLSYHWMGEDIFSSHPLERYGCISCHGGDPASLYVKGAHRMGTGFVTGDGTFASCYYCHGYRGDLPLANRLNSGRRSFIERGCLNCHPIEGIGTERFPIRGRDLSNIGDRSNRAFLERWIRNPRRIHLSSRMPLFPVDDEEMESLLAYLLSRREETGDRQFPVPTSKITKEKGKMLLKEKNCSQCHIIQSSEGREGNDLAFPLVMVSEKVEPFWVYRWLTLPAKEFPGRRMPDMRLKGWEAKRIISALYEESSMEEDEEKAQEEFNEDKIENGRRAFFRWRCHLCHDTGELLDVEKEGVRVFREEEGIWEDGLHSKDMQKLYKEVKAIAEKGGSLETLSPSGLLLFRILTHGKGEGSKKGEATAVPELGLNVKEIIELTLFLRSVAGARSKEKEKGERIGQGSIKPYLRRMEHLERGKWAMKWYNCYGCHPNSDRGRTTFAPSLKNEGERVVFKFLLSYLLSPFDLRPRLDDSMPSFPFSKEDLLNIAIYLSPEEDFASLSKEIFGMVSGEGQMEEELSEEVIEKGREAWSLLKCSICHEGRGTPRIFGEGENPFPISQERFEEGWRMAPDLSFMRERIKREFALSIILSPEKVLSQTNMPNLSLSREEAESIIDFLMSGKGKGRGGMEGRDLVPISGMRVEEGKEEKQPVLPPEGIAPVQEEEISLKELMERLKRRWVEEETKKVEESVEPTPMEEKKEPEY